MFVFILVFLLFYFLFYHFYWKRKNLPPGPLPLPFIGNLLAFKFTDLDIQLSKWRNQFGDLHTLWIGEQPCISLNDAPTILETFLKDGETFAARPEIKWNDIIRFGHNNGLVFTSGEKWRENRRFTLHVFRNFGLGRNLMQERVLVEVTSLISEIKNEIGSRGDYEMGKEVSLQNVIDLGVGSIINGLTFGYRYGKEKEAEFQYVKKFASFLVKQVGNPIFGLMAKDPEWYRKFPICSSYYDHFKTEIQKMTDFFFSKIEEHRNSINFETEEEPTNFCDAYLRHQWKLKNDGGELSGEAAEIMNFDDAQLYATILDLWIAGQETTSNTLAWLFVYLIRFPEIQAKLQQELDEVIGGDRIITLDDKSNLNFVNAVVAETQRFCNLIPLNLFHLTTKSTEIHGFQIPKNSVITHQISTVLMDERYFPEPQKFKPERFLDKSGKFFQPPELMPFGVGKRACMGEGLARLELYLFTVNIMNQFKLDFPSNKTDFGKKIFGGTVIPAPFLCSITNRF